MKVLSFVLLSCIFVATALAGGVTLAVNEIPQWDLCKYGGDIFSCSGHGMCSGPDGHCVCTDGYTGRDCSLPPGGYGYTTPTGAVTQFCQLETGGCAPGMCIGGGTLDSTSLPPGIDGVAAVNPTLYGNRYAYAPASGAGSDKTLNGMYSFVGDACGTCWKLTRGSVSIVVSIIDRCAGYCHASVATPGVANDQVCEPTGLGAKECGECIQSNHTSVPQCSCLSPASTNNDGWCDGYKAEGAHCDWCAANDHPHFDLDITSQMKICGDAAGDGFCMLDSFQMVACPALVGPWPNGYPNGTAGPGQSASSSTSSSSASGSSSNSASGSGSSMPTTCPYTLSNSVSGIKNEGDYMCNGCNLTLCHYGTFHSFGCPLGTGCNTVSGSAQCVVSSTCDPSIVSTTASASATAAPTQRPAAISTNAPPASATTKPVVATPAPAVATQAPATPAPASTNPPPASATTKPITVATPAPAVATQAPAAAAPSKTVTGTNWISAGSSWTYSSTAPASSWTQVTFDDSHWTSASAPFVNNYGAFPGYSGGGSFFGASNYYFRYSFNFNPSNGIMPSSMTVNTASDNQAAVYLNGVLVGQDTTSWHPAAYWNKQITFAPTMLVNGANVITIIAYNTDQWAYFDASVTVQFGTQASTAAPATSAPATQAPAPVTSAPATQAPSTPILAASPATSAPATAAPAQTTTCRLSWSQVLSSTWGQGCDTFNMYTVTLKADAPLSNLNFMMSGTISSIWDTVDAGNGMNTFPSWIFANGNIAANTAITFGYVIQATAPSTITVVGNPCH